MLNGGKKRSQHLPPVQPERCLSDWWVCRVDPRKRVPIVYEVICPRAVTRIDEIMTGIPTGEHVPMSACAAEQAPLSCVPAIMLPSALKATLYISAPGRF